MRPCGVGRARPATDRHAALHHTTPAMHSPDAETAVQQEIIVATSATAQPDAAAAAAHEDGARADPIKEVDMRPASPPRSPSLDFRSVFFNPLRALYTPGLQPPVPNAAPMDNISKFRRLLPPDHPDAVTLFGERTGSEVSRRPAPSECRTSGIMPRAASCSVLGPRSTASVSVVSQF